MEEKIKAVLAGVLDVAPGDIGEDFGPDNCRDWDSLASLRLVSALEKEFAVTFSWPEISSMTGFARIRDVIGRRLGEK